ncbi:GAF domain-containing protein [uncultured Cellulomonas sp.]|uniref:helix-turn-helix transcriptional regulator n=1 Tax=uncultured Cellulomonas sp. TaxID=189682 RepID=UPI002606013D|nr:GAF domain-containing protein [uncultured Cellulomonas sp.]
MTVDDDRGLDRAPGPAGEPFRLDRAVASLYTDLRLTPMLHTLLARTRELVGGVAGSISVIDPDAGTYSKVAERGISCQLGRTFSLDEGATGHAVARRSPVVIADYSAITGRHLAANHPANRGAVAAVPIWWRGELIGVNVAFAGRRERFTTAEVDRLEVLTQTAAGAIITAGAGDPALTRLLRASRRGEPAPAAAPGGGASGTHAAARVHPPVRPAPPATPTPLTGRESEVLTLVALGLGDREIARRLVLSPKTVEKHVGSAIRKTGSASRTGAAVRGREHGWI